MSGVISVSECRVPQMLSKSLLETGNAGLTGGLGVVVVGGGGGSVGGSVGLCVTGKGGGNIIGGIWFGKTPEDELG